MKPGIKTAAVLLIFLAYGLFLSQYSPNIMTDEIVTKNPEGFYDYRGITNVHTDRNKGSRPAKEIIKEAQDAKLDFIFFTDLNDFKSSPVKNGYHNNLLVFWSGTYSYLDAHLLNYNRDGRQLLENLGDAQMMFSETLSTDDEDRDEFIVLAHPLKDGENWRGPYPVGLNGIEVINLKSVWKEAWTNTRTSFFWSVFVYPFNSHLALIRLFINPEKELELWDRLNKERKTIGFVGNETTARTLPIGKGLFRFPTYKDSFDIASNHVILKTELTGRPIADRNKIFDALKKGQFYMSLDILANPKGFISYIQEAGSGKKHLFGSEIAYSEDLRIHVNLPEKPKVPFEVVVLKDGISVGGSNSKTTDLKIPGPGVYRVYVRVIPTFPLPDGKKWVTWIYSNPFYVTDSE